MTSAKLVQICSSLATVSASFVTPYSIMSAIVRLRQNSMSMSASVIG
nr:MAG TPA: hypothetical protein [Caudoviricetes sp.]